MEGGLGRENHLSHNGGTPRERSGVTGRRGKPVVLTIAGSDNSAGAGAQADLKTISYFGCYGLTAITCVVAEVPGKVSAIQAMPPDIVAEQVSLSLSAFPVAAAKTGMLFSSAIVEAVADALAGSGQKLVVDPVMVASSGETLLKKSAIQAYRRALLPLATLVTPNLDESRILAGREIRSLAEMKEAGKSLVERYGCAFLLKGGHLRGKMAVDVLVTASGLEEFAAPFVKGVTTHGTGCTYSAAVASGLANGRPLGEAVSVAKRYVTESIEKSLRWGKTHALDHFPA
jgi:hydroxymethylpyrimidine/phosphomethylpyrimidine kinase